MSLAYTAIKFWTYRYTLFLESTVSLTRRNKCIGTNIRPKGEHNERILKLTLNIWFREWIYSPIYSILHLHFQSTFSNAKAYLWNGKVLFIKAHYVVKYSGKRYGTWATIWPQFPIHSWPNGPCLLLFHPLWLDQNLLWCTRNSLKMLRVEFDMRSK